MKKNIVRIGILGVLILLCIWQTITLWLGSMAGHNFFVEEQEKSYAQYNVFPKQIWANINGNAYKIEGTNSEESIRYRLLTELGNELRRDNVQVTDAIKMSYTNLLSAQGIVYQYGTPLSLSEIAGKSFTKDNKALNAKVKDIFIDVSSNDSYKAYAYLIDENNEVRYRVTINNKLPAHFDALRHFTSDEFKEDLKDCKLYQASLLSANDSEKFEGNIFYPVNNNLMPITYEQLSFQPIIMEGDMQELESRINHLFKNPIYKQMTENETSIVFNDKLNLSVKYEKTGTLEFKKSITDTGEKLTSVDRMNKIYSFIDQTEAIPSALKEGLYLQRTIYNAGSGDETYYFGYQYENNDVVLGKAIREKLGINAYLKLTINNSEIVSGKWLMMEPFVLNSSINELSTEFYEAVSSQADGEALTGSKMTDLECGYLFNSLDDVFTFRWIPFNENGEPEIE